MRASPAYGVAWSVYWSRPWALQKLTDRNARWERTDSHANAGKGCTLAPPGEYDGSCFASAVWAVATTVNPSIAVSLVLSRFLVKTAASPGLSSWLLITALRLPSVLWHCWLGGRKGIRPVKNWVVGCWRGYLSGARCRLAYGPADATATHCLLLQ